MPGKEFTDPCVDCKDAEASLTVRGRRLCRYVLVARRNSGV